MLYNITIMGEVSRFSVYGNHAYFTLKDDNAEIKCACFNYSKTYKPKAGESILATGTPDFYPKKGELSFKIDKIKPVGQGLLYLKLEELKKKLKEEGLFDESYKKPIPQFPKNICVVTSINGAVIRDIVTTIRLRNDIINIKVYDVRVQGDGASKTIIKALNDVDSIGYDVIIIARGGGSLEDLMPFNDEALARIIFNLRTPIISAVGHETDFTIADFVADKRAATPTAAAEIISYNVEEWRNQILRYADRMHLNVSNLYRKMNTRLLSNISLMSSASRLLLESNCNKVNYLINKSIENINNVYIRKEHNLNNLITVLDANSPIKLLKNGYYRINRDNTPIYSVKQLKSNDIINITGGDGSIKAKVIDTEVKDEV